MFFLYCIKKLIIDKNKIGIYGFIFSKSRIIGLVYEYQKVQIVKLE